MTLELKGVSKNYPGGYGVKPVDFFLDRSTTAVLIGPSGCGKSTLLRMILGLIKPDAGSVWLDGEELTKESALRLRRKVGYVVQDGGLFPHLTGRENVLLMSKFLKCDAAKSERRLAELAEITKLPECALKRYPSQLSGGQKQRLSLIRALMLNPELLLLDEPMGALDPMIRVDLQRDLRQIFRTLNKTVIMVTHDLAEAFFLGDEIILMHEGRVVQRGCAGDLCDTPREDFVSQFLSAHQPLDLGRKWNDAPVVH